MGISMFVGDTDDFEYRMGSSYWYNRFLNDLSEKGQFPHILAFAPDKGVAHGAFSEYDTDSGEVSLSGLNKEVDSILSNKTDYPDWLIEMATTFKSAISKAVKLSEVLVIQ